MIRRFVSKDLDQVLRIWLEENIEAHGFISSEYWEGCLFDVKRELPKSNLFVFEENDEILGFAGMQGNYLAGIFVRSEHQSLGIGKALLDFLKQYYDEIALCVYEENCRAVNFYKRESFLIKSTQTDKETLEKELVMKWRKQ